MAGGWNLYQYCGGEPWGFVDPSGLAPESNYFWDGLELLWNGGKYAPRQEQLSPLDGVSDNASEQLVDAYFAEGVAGRGSGGTEEFNRKAAQIGNGLSVAAHAAGFVVLVVTPGPEDVIIAGLASKYGLQSIAKIGGEIFGRTADGKKVVLEAADAVKAAQAFRARQVLDRAYDSGILGKNLEAVGVMRRANGFRDEAHHIIGNSAKAAELRSRLDRAGININSAENGMWLDRSFHQTLNNQGYRDQVIDSFNNIIDEKEMLATDPCDNPRPPIDPDTPAFPASSAPACSRGFPQGPVSYRSGKIDFGPRRQTSCDGEARRRKRIRASLEPCHGLQIESTRQRV